MATAGQVTVEGHPGRITLTQGNCLPACLVLLLVTTVCSMYSALHDGVVLHVLVSFCALRVLRS